MRLKLSSLAMILCLSGAIAAGADVGLPSKEAQANSAGCLSRGEIDPYELNVAGNGNPQDAPGGLVAIFGDSRLRHWNDATCLGFSADGETVISAGADSTVRFWSVQTGKQQRAIPYAHGGAVLSADGSTLFLGEPDGTIRSIDVSTGRVLREISLRNRERGMLEVSRDGRALAAVGRARNGPAEVVIVDAASGEVEFRFKLQVQRLQCLALSPDASMLAAGFGHRFTLLDLEKKQAVRTVDAHFDPDDGSPAIVYALEFSPDGRRLASSGAEGGAKLWDVETGRELSRLKHFGTVRDLRFNGQGDLLATAGGTAINLWDWQKAQHLWSVPADASSLAFSQDGRLVAAAAGHNVKLVSVQDRQELNPTGRPRSLELTAFAVGPEGKHLVAGTSQGEFVVYDLATGKSLRRWLSSAEPIRQLVFRPDGRILAAKHGRIRLQFWDAESGQRVQSPNEPEEIVGAVAFAADGSLFAWESSTRAGRAIRIWDFRRSAVVAELQGRARGQIAFSPDKSRLYTTDSGNTLTIWDLTEQRELDRLGAHTLHDDVPLAVHPEGRYVAAGDMGEHFSIWNVDTNAVTDCDDGHDGLLLSLAFSPDGEQLASSAQDGRVQLWQARTGEVGRTLKIGPGGGVIRQVAFTPDGHHLVTANGNGTVYVLRLE